MKGGRALTIKIKTEQPKAVLESYASNTKIRFETPVERFNQALSTVEPRVKHSVLNDDVAVLARGKPVKEEPAEPDKGDKGKEEEEEVEESLFERVAKKSSVPYEDHFKNKVTTLQNYQLRDDRDQAHFGQLAADARIPESRIGVMPSYKDVLRYVTEFKDAPPFYDRIVQMVVNTEGANFPQLEVLDRSYIQRFLRAPDPHVSSERECANPNCESFRLSSILLERNPELRQNNLQRGFKCRELLMPSKYVQIEAERRKPGGNPRQLLDSVIQPCYFCHLHLTNRAYWLRLNRNQEKHEGDEDDATVILHRFIVLVNVEGEYKLENMLLGDTEPMGIIGPFPHYNVNNYLPYVNTRGLCCWQESDKLVFRLPDQQLQRIAPPAKSTSSHQSGRTTSHQRRIASRK